MSKKDKDKDEDRALWALITNTIKPLKDRDLPAEEDDFSKNAPDSAEQASERPKPDDPGLKIPESDFKAAQQTPPPKKPASRDVDKRSLQKLKRGQYKIEGRLDLHGMTQIQARDSLFSFLQSAFHQGKRCVLVITGKGRQSFEDEVGIPLHREKGVLKQSLPGWLDAPECRDIVLQHCQAQPKHGGSGAFYILLRRQRT